MPQQERGVTWRLSERAKQIASQQRRHFNELVDVFDTPQPEEVLQRLRKIVAAAGIQPGEVVLDVGTGVGVLVPLIESYGPSEILVCDVAEKMLARVRQKYPAVLVHHGDISVLPLAAASIDVIFMNAVYGNIADKSAACRNSARMLRPGGRLVVSHPEGRAFVDRLRQTGVVFIESLPTREAFRKLLEPLDFKVTHSVDEPQLYLMVARKERECSGHQA